MSTSMVSTVLGIEREAEKIVKEAESNAVTLVADAKARAHKASEAAKQATASEVAKLEAQAAEDRAKKVQELTASGKASLAMVKNVTDAAFDKGVSLIMQALAGKKK